MPQIKVTGHAYKQYMRVCIRQRRQHRSSTFCQNQFTLWSEVLAIFSDKASTALNTTHSLIESLVFWQTRRWFFCKHFWRSAKPPAGVIWTLYANVEAGAPSQRVAMGLALRRPAWSAPAGSGWRHVVRDITPAGRGRPLPSLLRG